MNTRIGRIIGLTLAALLCVRPARADAPTLKMSAERGAAMAAYPLTAFRTCRVTATTAAGEVYCPETGGWTKATVRFRSIKNCGSAAIDYGPDNTLTSGAGDTLDSKERVSLMLQSTTIASGTTPPSVYVITASSTISMCVTEGK